jgi:hypothetical protein
MASPNSRFFTKQKDRVIFIGKTLEIYIPERFAMHNCLIVENTVKTLGLFDMVINGSIKSGYKLAAMVEICPSEIDQVTRHGAAFYKLTLYKGDVFLTSQQYVRTTKLSYVLFYEMGYSGHYPEFVSYDDHATIYDYIGEVTGLNTRTNHAIIEMIASQLARDKDDITKLYRLTDMRSAPKIMGLHSIAQIATSATSKLNGAYMRSGMESTLANEASSTNSDVEDLLRS